VKKAYLRGAGYVMSGMEWLQRRHPALAQALKIPARISPLTSDVMAHHPATRLNIRIPTG
jgi:hypothetical protein